MSSELLESSHAPYKLSSLKFLSSFNSIDSVSLIINFFLEKLSNLVKNPNYFSIVLFDKAKLIIYLFIANVVKLF